MTKSHNSNIEYYISSSAQKWRRLLFHFISLYVANKKFSVGSTENLKSRFVGAHKSYLTGYSFTNFAALTKKN